MKKIKWLVLTLGLITFTACESKTENALEDVGEAVEETTEEAVDAVKDASEDAADVVDDATN